MSKLEKWVNHHDFIDMKKASESILWEKAPVIKLIVKFFFSLRLPRFHIKSYLKLIHTAHLKTPQL